MRCLAYQTITSTEPGHAILTDETCPAKLGHFHNRTLYGRIFHSLLYDHRHSCVRNPLFQVCSEDSIPGSGKKLKFQTVTLEYFLFQI